MKQRIMPTTCVYQTCKLKTKPESRLTKEKKKTEKLEGKSAIKQNDSGGRGRECSYLETFCQVGQRLMPA